MVHILETIVPVFLVILLGVLVRCLGFLPGSLTGPLNRLVYYVAIPAMIFDALAKASFAAHFQPAIVLASMVPLLLVFAAAVLMGRLLSVPRREMGTFTQSSFHGNLGYIGFAVAFYLLGTEGFTRAGILAGFLMLLQNLLSVICLQLFSEKRKGRLSPGKSFKKIVVNPVILSSLAGMVYNLSGLGLPIVVSRTLNIVAGMSLPLALLVIGASLSFNLVRTQFRIVVPSAFMKLVLLPATGLLMFEALGIKTPDFLPAFILLAAPSATVTYVMALELDGSPDQASASVSISTLLSSLSYVAWLSVLT